VKEKMFWFFPLKELRPELTAKISPRDVFLIWERALSPPCSTGTAKKKTLWENGGQVSYDL
jgi:hypothetical protein